MSFDEIGNPFENRCKNDPQGVIKDLLGQTSRQGAEIYRLSMITESVLLVPEAAYLTRIVELQPENSTRDLILKKLKAIIDSEVKQNKKKKI